MYLIYSFFINLKRFFLADTDFFIVVNKQEFPLFCFLFLFVFRLYFLEQS